MKINYKDSGDITSIDSEFEVPVYSPICSFCSRLDLTKERGCEAFKTIPLEIWLGENDHTKPYEGDNGILFKKKENEQT